MSLASLTCLTRSSGKGSPVCRGQSTRNRRERAWPAGSLGIVGQRGTGRVGGQASAAGDIADQGSEKVEVWPPFRVEGPSPGVTPHPLPSPEIYHLNRPREKRWLAMFRQSLAAAPGAAGLPPVGLLGPLPGAKRGSPTARRLHLPVAHVKL